jgi:peptidoglycan glycosyltransferase
MNAPLRRVGIVTLALFGLLFLNLNWVQAYRADEYRNHENNCRVNIADADRQRGTIVVGTGREPAAASEPADGFVDICGTGVPIHLQFIRDYPFAQEYAHVIGYRPVQGVASGIEGFENEILTGTSDKLFVERVREVFTGGAAAGGNVVTTLRQRAQQTAFEQLRDNNVGAAAGAVVALDPRTGAVQAMVSMPWFDPNRMVSHDLGAASEAYQELDNDEREPLLNRVISQRYPPGSVFKVIDSAAALQNGYEPDTTLIGGSEYLPPTAGGPIGNAPGVVCPDEITLAQALVVSCNTAFSRLMAGPADGEDAESGALGGDLLTETAAEFGVGDEELQVGRLTGDGLPVAQSQIGDLKRDDGQDDAPTVAQSAIGQANVAFTPMQAALIGAAVANDGVQMAPYLVEQLQAPDLRSIYTADPEELRRAVPGDVAAELRDMMVAAVEQGTGGNARVSGVVIGGKTGTAETGDAPDHGWFVGFAIVDGEPVSAVAVMLENAGPGGSGEAARIAGEVLGAVVEEQGGD